MLDKMSSVVPFIRNNIFLKYKAAADELEMQTWYNKERLRFQELREGFDLVFNGTQLHMGLQFWHQELKDACAQPDRHAAGSARARWCDRHRPAVPGGALPGYKDRGISSTASVLFKPAASMPASTAI